MSIVKTAITTAAICSLGIAAMLFASPVGIPIGLGVMCCGAIGWTKQNKQSQQLP